MLPYFLSGHFLSKPDTITTPLTFELSVNESNIPHLSFSVIPIDLPTNSVVQRQFCVYILTFSMYLYQGQAL